MPNQKHDPTIAQNTTRSQSAGRLSRFVLPELYFKISGDTPWYRGMRPLKKIHFELSGDLPMIQRAVTPEISLKNI
jgi:hypothetical protein